ncbi:hypothetical protein Z043_104196 [Scleropages formosus]|uniref:Fanconi anemia group C protein-like n=1 Tax=Scleropages formosus TaxID=113540 RepID=A0A0P7V4Q1_SCLFO|nr:hypothetical protein Z043_104196 [Scleropages formosus]
MQSQGCDGVASDWTRAMSSSVPFPGQLMEFWMGKAVEWDQTKTPAVQFDSSTREAIERFPFIGQLLGRLCWNSYVTADEESRDCLLRCLCCMYSAQPQGAVELKANQWIQNLLCLLSTEDDSSTAQAVFNHCPAALNEGFLEAVSEALLRWHHRLFESWFLLLQCSDWVDVAAQVLVTSSQESSTTLLWLLAFYYHPANNEQQRTQALVKVRCGFTRQLLALLAGIEHRLNGRETHERLKNLRTFCIEHK